MTGALLYLRIESLRGRLTSGLRRLRQPKYIAGLLASIAYFYLLVFRHLRGPAHGFADIDPDEAATIGAAILLVVLFAQTVLAWISAEPEARLRFTEAEIAFLFPAPMSRSRLIHFNLLSSQFTILCSSVLLSVIFGRGRFLPGNAVTHALGWWIILSTITLFRNAMNFGAARLMAGRGAGMRRRMLALLGLAGFFLARSLWLHARTPEPGELASVGQVSAFIAGWLESGFGHSLLAPFVAVIRPFAAASAGSFFAALGPSLLPSVVFYCVVLGLEVPFREGSIVGASKTAQRRARGLSSAAGPGANARLKPRRDPFLLTGRGRPESAFLWKNLVGIQSWFSLRLFIRLLSVAVLVAFSLTHVHFAAASAVFIGAAIVAGYSLLIGPQLVRQDLRSDLAHADILKTYPLPGWQVVLGQMLTPMLLLSGILWFCILAAAWALFSGLAEAAAYSLGTRVIGLACAAAVVPPIVCLQLIVPNGAALLFPAWHQATRGRPGGFEVLGQRLIFVFGQLLATIIALVPPVVLAGLVALATFHYIGIAAAVIFATGASLAVLAGEAWIGVWLLGAWFERLDVASELSP